MERKESIGSVPGIGKTTKGEFAKLGIETLGDMLRFAPRAYDDRREERLLRSLSVDDQHINCRITVRSKSYFPSKRGRTLKATCTDDDGNEIDVLCFNRDYLDRMLVTGSVWFINANVEKNRGRYSTSQFEIKRRKEEIGIGKILPIYPLSGNLTEKIMRTASSFALSTLSPIKDELPDEMYGKYNLVHHEKAYRDIHYPKNLSDVEKARRTLAFTELLLMEINAIRERGVRVGMTRSVVTPIEKKLISSLPFSLTPDQEKVLGEIRADLDSKEKMERLLQGDVGSGKTLVAWISALHVISKGGQVAFMAPTELLARQHADKAAELLSKLGVRICFLSGDVKGKGRLLLIDALKKGNVDLAIGTHALFSQDVAFKNLKYVIIDEQHRFGVEQREALRRKGLDPDVLSMTATPIPRTLALTFYANLEISTIKTMPEGRIPVKTHLVSEKKREEMLDAIEVEFKRSHQAYFVYPRIEGDEEENLRDVNTMFQELQRRYPEYKARIVHSKLPEEEKLESLNLFREGKIQYLVSTSVVEVGIDVPNATVMVIEHAERFGLAALHQLRGRVGRSSIPSYCFLVFSGTLTDEGIRRLKVMRDTNDGFKIAEEDLLIRGPGEITGNRQSGFLKLKFASPVADTDLIAITHDEAMRIVRDDKGLLKAENQVLRASLAKS